MINQIGGFEDVVERAGGTAQNVKKSAQKGAGNFVKTTTTQVMGGQSSQAQDQGTDESGAAGGAQAMSDDQAKQFLKDLYGVTDKNSNTAAKNPGSSPANQQTQQNPVAAALGMTPKNPNEGKSPEELVKIEGLRKELHADYYRRLTNPQKQVEENVTEKLEREEQQAKFEDLEREKKKPSKLPQTQKVGTGENVVGVSG